MNLYYDAWIGIKKYEFRMRNHISLTLNPYAACEEIARWIHDESLIVQSDWSFVFPQFRYAWVLEGHPLYPLLDLDSRQAGTKNWLIFDGNPFGSSKIRVTHFGPLGRGNNEETKDKFDNVQRLLDHEAARYGLSNRELRSLSSGEIKSNVKRFVKYCREKYLALRTSRQTQLEQLKENLAVHARRFLSPEASGRMVQNISASIGKGIVKAVIVALVHEITTLIVKSIAKEIAKISAKQATKSAIKKIPIAGVIVGGFFGVGRFLSGDPVGALGEFASGAASTIPGIGTAASLAIDGVMIGRDIAEEVNRLQAIEAEVRSIQVQIENIADQLEKFDGASNSVFDCFENDAFDFAENAESFFTGFEYLHQNYNMFD